MWRESLLKFVIPLMFLGIWSWTSLLNEEDRPSRSRTTRRSGRIGRPGQPDPMWDRELDGYV